MMNTMISYPYPVFANCLIRQSIIFYAESTADVSFNQIGHIVEALPDMGQNHKSWQRLYVFLSSW